MFRWFADPVYARGYPADMVEHYSKLGAFPNGMDFARAGDMNVIATPTDFIGLNYYSRNLHRADVPDNSPQIDFPLPKTPEHWTEMDWENYPDGLTGVLGRVYFDYLPRKIYITENGASGYLSLQLWETIGTGLSTCSYFSCCLSTYFRYSIEGWISQE